MKKQLTFGFEEDTKNLILRMLDCEDGVRYVSLPDLIGWMDQNQKSLLAMLDDKKESFNRRTCQLISDSAHTLEVTIEEITRHIPT